MKILVTAGATREPIDAVRFISNISTGATGAALADEFGRRGQTVVLLRGDSAARSKGTCETEAFGSAAELEARLRRRLASGEFDAVIMAAAVADYRPADATRGKISSAPAELTLRLVRNEKILPRLKSFAPQPLRVVGFKLTAAADAGSHRAAVEAQFAAGGVDAVVHNDLVEIRVAAVHPFQFWKSAAAAPVQIAGVPALAEALLKYLEASPA